MLNSSEQIKRAQEHLGKLLEGQLARIERMKATKEFINYDELETIIIGVVGGDGIGPYITAEAQRVLEFLLKEEVQRGKIKFKVIEGLTIENRAKVGKAIPEDILEELKQCHVILKGPTTTPRAGDPWPNIESANVAMRKEWTFANVDRSRYPRKILTGSSTEKTPRSLCLRQRWNGSER